MYCIYFPALFMVQLYFKHLILPCRKGSECCIISEINYFHQRSFSVTQVSSALCCSHPYPQYRFGYNILNLKIKSSFHKQIKILVIKIFTYFVSCAYNMLCVLYFKMFLQILVINRKTFRHYTLDVISRIIRMMNFQTLFVTTTNACGRIRRFWNVFFSLSFFFLNKNNLLIKTVKSGQYNWLCEIITEKYTL